MIIPKLFWFSRCFCISILGVFPRKRNRPKKKKCQRENAVTQMHPKCFDVQSCQDERMQLGCNYKATIRNGGGNELFFFPENQNKTSYLNPTITIVIIIIIFVSRINCSLWVIKKKKNIPRILTWRQRTSNGLVCRNLPDPYLSGS